MDSAASASAGGAAASGLSAGAVNVKKEDDDIDLNDVKEVELIDLTTEEIDLTQDPD